jgi:hypothetical protein
MHRLSVGEQEQLLQLESVAKASWFGHDPGDGDPSPCDDRSSPASTWASTAENLDFAAATLIRCIRGA